MTKKDYKILADVILRQKIWREFEKINDGGLLERLTNDLMECLKIQNNRFDYYKFLEATKTPKEKKINPVIEKENN